MRKIRIGKDINLRWHIEVPDGSGPLSDMNLALYMNGPQGMHVLIEDATVGVDAIEFTLRGTLFSQLGDYSLTCWKNKGEQGQTVLDAVRAFTLVKSSDQEADYHECGCNELELATVDLRTELQIDLLGYFNDPAIIARLNDLTARVEALEQHEDVVELTGSLSYAGSAPAAGGSLNPSNSLRIMKNGVAQQVAFVFSSDQPYASVEGSTGVVTFTASQSTSQRTATVTASCTFEGQAYSRTAIVKQAAYVPPVETDYIYAGGYTSWDPTMSISDFTEISHVNSSTKTISFTVNGYNIIGVLCPTSMNLTLAKHLGEIEEDLTQEMLGSVTTVTYNNKSYKMYQFKFLTGILSGENFRIDFN